MIPDPAAHLRSADPRLAVHVDAIGPLTPAPGGDPYEELVRMIIYQQLAGKAAATIEGRFLDIFGGRSPRPDELLAVEDERLRAAGLSRQKSGYLRDLAAKARDGALGDDLHTLPDDEVIARVTTVKGIGRWTADMLLIFCLRRPDVLPVGDLGVRKAMQHLYELPELPTPARMEEIAAPWRPHRSTASRYLWRWLDTRTP